MAADADLHRPAGGAVADGVLQEIDPDEFQVLGICLADQAALRLEFEIDVARTSQTTESRDGFLASVRYFDLFEVALQGALRPLFSARQEIGRASCRERV